MPAAKSGMVPIGLLVLLAVVAVLPSAARAEDVSGPWDLTVETPQGTGTPSVVFKQSGESLTGTYRGRMGESAIEGTLKGSDIRFTVRLRFQEQDFTIAYAGKVEGDAMKGSVRFGDAASGTWTARRKK
jgi:hypothetical protein